MKNPFDQTFFKFLLGFVFILSVNFVVLFVVAKINSTNSQNQSVVVKTEGK